MLKRVTVAGMTIVELLILTLVCGTATAAPQPTIATRRARLDVTTLVDATRTIPLALVTPAMAANIGPGSHLLIEIPGEGTFGCTANFIWAGGTTRYLGAAGHCFIPQTATATHGPGADYDASGVVVSVCVSNCSFGGETGFTLTGDLVQLGRVAYARQTAADGDIGNDFGVVTIPAALASRIRPAMPVFGGPSRVEQVSQGTPLCHFGNGVGVGEVFLTQARVGVGGGANNAYWLADLASAPGDSGSAVVTCESDGSGGLRGRGAAGALTHLSAEVCPCDVNSLTFQQGVVFGTTIPRAIAMAQEAGLSLSVVNP
jgi:hypothetical protein